MSLPLELFIGLRYLRAKKRNHFISFISLISILGTALAIGVLITVLSVMNGFQEELRNRILVMTSHVTVTGVMSGLKDWQKVVDALSDHPEVTGSAPYIRGEVMLSNAGNVQAALIRGILPEKESAVSTVAGKMKAGSLDDLKPGKFGIILGHELARSLGVWPGDKITVVSPQITATPAGVLPRLKRFEIVGTFEVGMHEFDSGMVLMHIQDAAKLLRSKDEVSGVRFRIKEIFDAPQVGYEFSKRLGGDYWVSDWTRRHANFFRAVKMEKMIMFVLLSLLVAIAAFNIISTLVMVVTDKESDIAILRTLGLSPAGIMKIFMIQGTVIGVFGTLLGMAGGVALSNHVETIVQYIEDKFQTKFMDPSIYYISDLPSQVLWSDVILVCGLSFTLTVLATIYPAWRASKTHPVEALRYE